MNNNKLPFILAIVMMVTAVGLFSWQHNGDAQASVEQVEQVEQPVIPEFNPRRREFKLDDGTPCVMVWTPQTNFPREGSSGISCDWDNRKPLQIEQIDCLTLATDITLEYHRMRPGSDVQLDSLKRIALLACKE